MNTNKMKMQLGNLYHNHNVTHKGRHKQQADYQIY